MAQAQAVADFSPIAAAGCSAVLSTLIASPLDVLKTRMQTAQRCGFILLDGRLHLFLAIVPAVRVKLMAFQSVYEVLCCLCMSECSSQCKEVQYASG